MASLVVVGAGPKAVAVQAKAHALRRLGMTIPEIQVVDPIGVAGNWLPEGGWTDGRHPLGTSPFKDIGFPYRTRIADDPPPHPEIADTRGPLSRAVDRELLTLSWVRFLIETGRYASWIDRCQPQPRHRLWAEYLRWVAARTGLDLVRGRVTGMHAGAEGWSLSVCMTDGRVRTVTADALLVTGPGPSTHRIAEIPRVLSLAGFWKAIADDELPESSRIAVIGAGESAASVITEVIRHDVDEICLVSPAATVFSRGEGRFENAMYTDPRRWADLDEQARRDFIARTDRGVISVGMQDCLSSDDRVAHLRGRVLEARDTASGVELTMTDPARGHRTATFGLVIDARGGSPVWFTELMDPQTRSLVSAACGGELTARCFEDRMTPTLALAGLAPTLFVPALSGFRQGPGFANLSCLGELSDRILAGIGVGRLPESSPAARPGQLPHGMKNPRTHPARGFSTA